ncbi:hypothetical protein M0Q50_06570 [bacterium]|jgi:hypothetical protein|nr:hypothetical protein [bacterium]
MPDYTFIYNTPGDYTLTIPNGAILVIAECYGGGGCGASRTTNGYGAGGGGGAYSKTEGILPMGITLNIRVGDGGITTSGNSSLVFFEKTDIMCQAVGGGGVAVNGNIGGAGGAASSGIGQVKYSGGNGANVGTLSGGGGESAGTRADGNPAIGRIGGTGTDGGDGGDGAYRIQGPGNNGFQPGGGGGGAYRTSQSYLGGAGGNGKIIITITIKNAVLNCIDEFL